MCTESCNRQIFYCSTFSSWFNFLDRINMSNSRTENWPSVHAAASHRVTHSTASPHWPSSQRAVTMMELDLCENTLSWLISHRALILMCNARIGNASRFCTRGPSCRTHWFLHVISLAKDTNRSEIQTILFDSELIFLEIKCSHLSSGANSFYGLHCHLHISTASVVLMNSDWCCCDGILIHLVWWSIQCF